ncbi:MAG: tetratricopeptide repeat protein [Crocinitomicaceae bacterium]|nr:tetratricopeptide repeat protein [Crocinitomicaceae bacterium]
MKKKLVFIVVALISFNLLGQATKKNTAIYTNYYSGEELYEKKQYSSARNEFSTFLLKCQDGENPLHIKARYYDGLCALNLYNNDAISVLEKFIKDYPENIFVNSLNFEIGNFYFKTNNLKKAIAYYNKVEILSLEKDLKAPFLFKKGYANFKKGNITIAKNSFKEIKDGESSYASPALYYYSHICYKAKQFQLALPGFMKLYKNPKYKEKAASYIIQIKHHFGEYQEVVDFYNSNFENMDDLSLDLIHLTGDSYYQLKKYYEAIPFLVRYDKKSKTTRNDDYALGYSYLKTNRFYEAIRKLDNLLRPGDSLSQIAFYQIGDCYLELNNLISARAAFEKAAELSYDKEIAEDALYNFAVISFKLDFNPYDESVRAFELYIKTYPNSERKEDVLQYLVNVYNTTNHYEKALKSIENIVHADTKLKKVYQNVAYNYGVELFRKKSFLKAIEILKKVKKYPLDFSIQSQAKFWIAESNLRMNKTKEAIHLYKKYIKNPSGSSDKLKNDAYYNLAYAYLQKKDIDSAVVFFRLFTQSNTKNKRKLADAFARLADTYYMTKKDEEAIKYYKEVLKLNVGFEDQALYNISKSYGYIEKEDEKIESLLQILSKYKSSKYYLSSLFDLAHSYKSVKKDYVNAIKYFEIIINNYPEASFIAECKIEIADIYYKEWKYDLAKETYLDVLNKYNINHQICENAVRGLMEVYTALNKPDDATALAETHSCVQISTDEKENLYYNPALKEYNDSSFSNAIEKFEKYITTFPEGKFINEAYYFIANCYKKTNQDSLSIEAYKKLAKRPTNIYSEFAAGSVANELYNTKKYDRAIIYYEILEQVATKPSSIFNAQLGMMRTSYLLNKYDTSNVYANKVLENPSLNKNLKREACYAKGMSNINLKDYEEAKKPLSWIVKNTNDIWKSKAKYYLAEIDFNNDELSASEKKIKELIKLKPNYYYWVAKGLLLETKISIKKDDLFQAEQTLKSIIDNYPDKTDGILDEANALMVELLALKNTPKSIEIEQEKTIEINEEENE